MIDTLQAVKENSQVSFAWSVQMDGGNIVPTGLVLWLTFPAGLGEKSLPTVVEIYLKGLLNIFLFVSVSPLVLVGATLGQAGSPWSGGWFTFRSLSINLVNRFRTQVQVPTRGVLS